MKPSIKVYLYEKCGTCRQATRFLDGLDISYQAVSIRHNPPTRDELIAMLHAVGGDVRRLLNTSGREYRRLRLGESLQHLSAGELIAALHRTGSLVKRPVLIGPGVHLVGFNESAWRQALAGKDPAAATPPPSRPAGLKIAIASDHAGLHYKEFLKVHLTRLGHHLVDFGTGSAEACDYPDFVRPAAQAVADGKADVGIVLGGSGNGEAIAANKVSGIRCGLCWNEESARLTKQHNNANVISIGERMVTPAAAKRIVEAWLEAKFEGGRHQRRIDKIESAADAAPIVHQA